MNIVDQKAREVAIVRVKSILNHHEWEMWDKVSEFGLALDDGQPQKAIAILNALNELTASALNSVFTWRRFKKEFEASQEPLPLTLSGDQDCTERRPLPLTSPGTDNAGPFQPPAASHNPREDF